MDELPFEVSVLVVGEITGIVKWVVIPGVDELIPELGEGFEVKFIDDPLTLTFYADFEYSLLLVEVDPDLELHFILGCVKCFNVFFFPVGQVIFLLIFVWWIRWIFLLSSVVILELLGVGTKINGEDDDIRSDLFGFEEELFLNWSDFEVILGLQQFEEVKKPHMIVIVYTCKVIGDEILPENPVKIGLNIQ